MLLLTLALDLDSVVIELRRTVLFNLLLLKRKSRILAMSILNDQYEEVCKEGLRRGIPEAVALGCWLYGDMLRDSAMYDEAIRMYRYALGGLSNIRVEGERVPVILSPGVSYLSKDKVDEVLKLLRADIYNDLGIAYYHKDEYDMAIGYYIKALSIYLKTLGPNHPEVAMTYGNLGIAYANKGDYDRAIEYFNKALSIYLKTLGPNHPEVAQTYLNLGSTYANKGEYDRAIEFYNKALSIYLKTLGPNHSIVALIYEHLGRVYKEKGDKEKAKEYFRKAKEIRRKSNIGDRE